jgi:branched-chain amino acid transport system permease protein
MFGRPNLHTSYKSEAAMLPTWTQRVLMALLCAVALLLVFDLPVINQIPFVRFLGDSDWLSLLTRAVIFAIAALGLNVLTGVAGQISLGHAFFMGAGAYAAVVLGGQSGPTVWGLGLPMWIWLPGAGITAALVGVIIAPAAVRVRGLYLGIVTVGLVFLGIHLSRVFPEISGPSEVGRTFPPLEWKWWKEETPVISFAEDGHWLWFDITGQQKSYLFCLVLLGVAVVEAKNIHRTRTRRALQAIRDRDVAAEVMGVPEVKYKVIAFGASSFFAGISGALFASYVGKLPPEEWDLILSVEFIAILLIGGAGITSGVLLGTFFVVLLPRFIEQFVHWMSNQAAGDTLWAGFWDIFVSADADDFGFVSDAPIAPGFPLPSNALDSVIYGALVIVFLLFEPRGLYGIWVRVRNYWKGWPFSY